MDTTNEAVSSVTLMILGDDLDPSTVSHLLELEPSQSWKRGEEKRLARGRIHQWGGWKRFSPENDNPVEEKISAWLSILTNKKEAFTKIKSYGWRASLDVFISFDEVATISISSEASRKIGELQLDLDFSLNTEEK